MEHAPLRPVPARPAGPIDPATAIREVGLWLPTVPPDAARAFALVVLAERPRSEAAASLGVSERGLGELLASARKELRQGIVTLGGSGWCERAEGLISDRLDGALAEGDVRRLDVHLRNCTRCVEHERRLVQATDALVGALGGAAKPSGGGAATAPLAEAPEEAPQEEAPSAGEAPDGNALTEAASQETSPEEVPPVEAPPEELPPGEDAPREAPPREVPPPDARTPAAEAPAPAAGPAEIAAAAEVLVAVRTRRQIAAAVVWNAMIALAVLLAVAAIALTVAGILGAEL